MPHYYFRPYFNFYNCACLPNDVHKSNTEECLPKENTTNIMPFFHGFQWVGTIKERPGFRYFLASLDERLDKKELEGKNMSYKPL